MYKKVKCIIYIYIYNEFVMSMWSYLKSLLLRWVLGSITDRGDAFLGSRPLGKPSHSHAHAARHVVVSAAWSCGGLWKWKPTKVKTSLLTLKFCRRSTLSEQQPVSIHAFNGLVINSKKSFITAFWVVKPQYRVPNRLAGPHSFLSQLAVKHK